MKNMSNLIVTRMLSVSKTLRNTISKIQVGKIVLPLLFLAFISISGCQDAYEEGIENQGIINETSKANNLPNAEIARLRAVVARYQQIENAIADGYDFEFTGYRTQMGYHYMKASLIDDTFEVEKPEVLMYAPAPNGGLRFVGVEYAVPIADLNNPQPAPEGFTGDADVWAVNTEFHVWTLHVWVGLQNPKGIFHPHNPRLP